MTTGAPTLRETTSGDLAQIVRIRTGAFGSGREAELTAVLLSDATAGPCLSLLASCGSETVGRILFTRCRIDGDPGTHYLLAPLAVAPAFQRQGIGAALIRTGLEMLRERGAELVFVLGDKALYAPSYGFLPGAIGRGFEPPRPIAAQYADCWMVQALQETDFCKHTGRLLCAAALDHPAYWKE